MNKRAWLGIIAVLAFSLVVALLFMPSLVRAGSAVDGVLPPQANPAGHSYAEWNAKWFQWAFGLSTDQFGSVFTGEEVDCKVGQSGRVWFLAGTFDGIPAQRSCTIPTGKFLLMPIVNYVYVVFASDPLEEQTEEFARAQANLDFYLEDATLAATVDGNAVENIEAYRVDSADTPIFDVALPEDNWLGITSDNCPVIDGALVCSPAAADGYYLLLAPLSPGEHIVHVRAISPHFEQDVTYQLTVKP